MKKLILTFFTIALVAGIAVAQGGDDKDDFHTVTIKIPKISLLDIEALSRDFDLEVTAIPNEAGEEPLFTATNSLCWLNVTSIIGPIVTSPVASGGVRKITVATNGATLPNGITLKVRADDRNTSFGLGTFGTAITSDLTLTSTSQELVSDIGSCFTGNGVGKGYKLNYSLGWTSNQANIAALLSGNTSVIVTYTLSDN